MKINSDFYSINTTFLYFLLFFLSRVFSVAQSSCRWWTGHVLHGLSLNRPESRTVQVQGQGSAPSWAGKCCSSFINTINNTCTNMVLPVSLPGNGISPPPQLFNCNTLEKCFPVFPHTPLGEQLHFHTRSSISHLNLGLLKTQVWASLWSIALTPSLPQSFKVCFKHRKTT